MDTRGLCPERDQMPCVQRIPCRASRCSFFETFVPFSVSWLQRLLQRPLPPCLGTSCCDRNMPRIIGIHTGIHVIILINVYSCYVPRFAVGMEQHARRSLKHNYQPKCLINIFTSWTGRYDKGSESETAAEGIRKVASTTILTGNYCWLRPTCWTLFSHASGNLRAHAVIFAEKYLRRWEWCSWLRGRAGRIVKGKLLSATSWPAPAETLMAVPPLGSRPRASPRQCALVSRFANIRHIQKLSKFHKWW